MTSQLQMMSSLIAAGLPYILPEHMLGIHERDFFTWIARMFFPGCPCRSGKSFHRPPLHLSSERFPVAGDCAHRRPQAGAQGHAMGEAQIQLRQEKGEQPTAPKSDSRRKRRSICQASSSNTASDVASGFTLQAQASRVPIPATILQLTTVARGRYKNRERPIRIIAGWLAV
jgi:hypothetical protein